MNIRQTTQQGKTTRKKVDVFRNVARLPWAPFGKEFDLECGTEEKVEELINSINKVLKLNKFPPLLNHSTHKVGTKIVINKKTYVDLHKQLGNKSKPQPEKPVAKREQENPAQLTQYDQQTRNNMIVVRCMNLIENIIRNIDSIPILDQAVLAQIKFKYLSIWYGLQSRMISFDVFNQGIREIYHAQNQLYLQSLDHYAGHQIGLQVVELLNRMIQNLGLVVTSLSVGVSNVFLSILSQNQFHTYSAYFKMYVHEYNSILHDISNAADPDNQLSAKRPRIEATLSTANTVAPVLTTTSTNINTNSTLNKTLPSTVLEAELAATLMQSTDDALPLRKRVFKLTSVLEVALYEEVERTGHSQQIEQLDNENAPDKIARTLLILGLNFKDIDYNDGNGYLLETTPEVEQRILEIYRRLTGKDTHKNSNASSNSNDTSHETEITPTRTEVAPIIRQIEAMHKKFYSNKIPYSKQIEASYIPKQDLLNFDPNATRPYFNEGNFYQAHYGNNFLIEVFTLRENGIAIEGPDVKDLINEISTR